MLAETDWAHITTTLGLIWAGVMILWIVVFYLMFKDM